MAVQVHRLREAEGTSNGEFIPPYLHSFVEKKGVVVTSRRVSQRAVEGVKELPIVRRIPRSHWQRARAFDGEFGERSSQEMHKHRPKLMLSCHTARKTNNVALANG
jgi:hypothetical protein